MIDRSATRLRAIAVGLMAIRVGFGAALADCRAQVPDRAEHAGSPSALAERYKATTAEYNVQREKLGNALEKATTQSQAREIAQKLGHSSLNTTLTRSSAKPFCP
jgi:hypothetical protein